MMCKNRDIYGFLGSSWVLITVLCLSILVCPNGSLKIGRFQYALRSTRSGIVWCMVQPVVPGQVSYDVWYTCSLVSGIYGIITRSWCTTATSCCGLWGDTTDSDSTVGPGYFYSTRRCFLCSLRLIFFGVIASLLLLLFPKIFSLILFVIYFYFISWIILFIFISTFYFLLVAPVDNVVVALECY